MRADPDGRSASEGDVRREVARVLLGSLGYSEKELEAVDLTNLEQVRALTQKRVSPPPRSRLSSRVEELPGYLDAGWTFAGNVGQDRVLLNPPAAAGGPTSPPSPPGPPRGRRSGSPSMSRRTGSPVLEGPGPLFFKGRRSTRSSRDSLAIASRSSGAAITASSSGLYVVVGPRSGHRAPRSNASRARRSNGRAHPFHSVGSFLLSVDPGELERECGPQRPLLRRLPEHRDRHLHPRPRRLAVLALPDRLLKPDLLDQRTAPVLPVDPADGLDGILRPSGPFASSTSISRPSYFPLRSATARIPSIPTKGWILSAGSNRRNFTWPSHGSSPIRRATSSPNAISSAVASEGNRPAERRIATWSSVVRPRERVPIVGAVSNRRLLRRQGRARSRIDRPESAMAMPPPARV